ncbi:MAG: hypothetical protein HC880_16065 [Bacteroidia bacterium]|nr:hypothetical protein [Bacteroidia bacterium]
MTEVGNYLACRLGLVRQISQIAFVVLGFQGLGAERRRRMRFEKLNASEPYEEVS